MHTIIVVVLIIISIALMCYLTHNLIFARMCVNCGCWTSHHNGVNMEEGFVCSECLHKTADPLPEEEDFQAEHAEEYYAGVEEHERQLKEFEEEMRVNGISIEDWFVDTIDKEEKP